MRRSFVAATVFSIALGATIMVAASTSALALPGARAGGAAPAPAGTRATTPTRATTAASFDVFLGFEVGEERRYVIGPDTAMRDGEEVTWSARLDRVEEGGAQRIGVFHLAHLEKRWGMGYRGSMFVHWKYDGELRVNEYGFPLELRFSMQEEHTGETPWVGEVMTAAYTFDGEQYIKEIMIPGQQWRFEFPIANDSGLDLSVPSGTFLFRPQAAGTNFLTNPALLGFALPDEMASGWQLRTMFFRPTDPVRFPDQQYVRSERDKVESLRRYWVKRTLTLGERQQLEIGGRTLNVRKLEITGSLRGAYVDEFGRVVRIDIDPDPYTRKNRHIRLLFPSEY